MVLYTTAVNPLTFKYMQKANLWFNRSAACALIYLGCEYMQVRPRSHEARSCGVHLGVALPASNCR